MMKKKISLKKIISLIGFLAVLILGLVFFNNPNNKMSVYPKKSIFLSLTRENDKALKLKRIAVENTYPIDYKNNLNINYLSILIKDEENNQLFEGKIINRQIIIVDSMVAVETVIPKEDFTSDISLYLPYYIKSSQVLIVDESGVTKLKINLKDYNLEVGKLENLCGNGLCDSNENYISCWSDCRFQIKEFFDKVAP